MIICINECKPSSLTFHVSLHRNALKSPGKHPRPLDLLSPLQELPDIPIRPDILALQERTLGGNHPDDKRSGKLN